MKIMNYIIIYSKINLIIKKLLNPNTRRIKKHKEYLKNKFKKKFFLIKFLII